MDIILEFLNARQQISERKPDAMQRFIVARPKMSAAQMPEGVQLVSRKITGKRVIAKGHRSIGNVRGMKARWPESQLEEWA